MSGLKNLDPFFRCAALFILLAFPFVALAQVPNTISYQGVLTDDVGQPVADGAHNLSFALYATELGGTALWSEDQAVDVLSGVFSVQLGSVSAFDLPFDAAYWLGISVGQDPELVPRLPLSSVPYSLQSRSVLGESNVFPSSGDVGIGTEGTGKDGTPVAKLDVEGNLRIADVPLDPAVTKILTHGDDQIVMHTPLDVLAGLGLVGPAGPAGPAGPQGPPGAGGGLLHNEALVIRNAAGDTTTVIYPDGTSFHYGKETFAGGINIPAGSFVEYADPQGEVWGVSDHNGTRYWLNQERTVVASIGESGIRIYDTNTNQDLFRVNPDGTSFHAGLETFAGGINVTNSSNQSIFRVDPTASYPTQMTGNVMVNGLFTANSVTANVKNFVIDHPLDPENMTLKHASIESSEMKNLYDGRAVMNNEGEAWIELPNWFEALNTEYRYQLTPIKASAPSLFIAEEVENGRFKIAGGSPSLVVSWQVTGVRHDKWAVENPMEVESVKTQR